MLSYLLFFSPHSSRLKIKTEQPKVALNVTLVSAFYSFCFSRPTSPTSITVIAGLSASQTCTTTQLRGRGEQGLSSKRRCSPARRYRFQLRNATNAAAASSLTRRRIVRGNVAVWRPTQDNAPVTIDAMRNTGPAFVSTVTGCARRRGGSQSRRKSVDQTPTVKQARVLLFFFSLYDALALAADRTGCAGRVNKRQAATDGPGVRRCQWLLECLPASAATGRKTRLAWRIPASLLPDRLSADPE